MCGMPCWITVVGVVTPYTSRRMSTAVSAITMRWSAFAAMFLTASRTASVGSGSTVCIVTTTGLPTSCRNGVRWSMYVPSIQLSPSHASSFQSP